MYTANVSKIAFSSVKKCVAYGIALSCALLLPQTSMGIKEVTIKYKNCGSAPAIPQTSGSPLWEFSQDKDAFATFIATADLIDASAHEINWTVTFNEETYDNGVNDNGFITDQPTKLEFLIPLKDTNSGNKTDLKVTATNSDNTSDRNSDTDDVRIYKLQLNPGNIEGRKPDISPKVDISGDTPGGCPRNGQSGRCRNIQDKQPTLYKHANPQQWRSNLGQNQT